MDTIEERIGIMSLHEDVGYNWIEEARYVLDEESDGDKQEIAEIVSELIDQTSAIHPWRDKLDRILFLLDTKYTKTGIEVQPSRTRNNALGIIQRMQEDMEEYDREIRRLVNQSNKELQQMAKRCRENGVNLRAKKITSELYEE